MLREVIPGRLLLGNARDARDLRLIHEHEIAAVVDLAIDEPPAQLARELIYCRLPLLDGDGNSDASLEFAIRTVANLVRHQVPTLVSCSGGMSRSPVIAAAAMAMVAPQISIETHLSGLVHNAPQEVSPALWTAVVHVVERLKACRHE